MATALAVLASPLAHGQVWDKPLWARNATYLGWDGPLRCVKVVSPDSRKTVYVGPIGFDVTVAGRLTQLPENAGVNTLAELLWAPDSSAFVVTQSDGGNVGTWFVAVYALEGNAVTTLSVSKAVTESFKKRYPCDEPEDPNIGAVAWLEASKMLLLAAEVPPHSTCRAMGKLGGFVVEVPGGRIVQELSEAELRTKWGRFLGERLRTPPR